MYNQSQLIAVPARDKMLKLDIVPNKKEFKPRDVASYTILRATKTFAGSQRRSEPRIIDEAIYSIQPETAANINASSTEALREVQTSLAILTRSPATAARNREPGAE